MIFYDRSISDAIKSRKFFKCVDVFSSHVTAKLTPVSSGIKGFRVVSLIYDESQILDIDLRAPTSYSNIQFYLLGYFIYDNGLGSPNLEVFNSSSYQKIELYVKGLVTSVAGLTNSLDNVQHVMNDQIVNKKDNAGTIPFRRINVFHSDFYVKNSQNNSIYKIVDIYRPAELSRYLTEPETGSQASWFVTALLVNSSGETSVGTLTYIKNPQILE